MTFHYDSAFFDNQQSNSLKSARHVSSILLKYISPSSVIDVGCGRGTWLQALSEAGIEDYLGVDGDYVERAKLLIPTENFVSLDLSKPFTLPTRKFDLAICLEVAEHLPETMGPLLVEQLTQAAPLVLFSSALPGQGGTAHINEQPVTYWKTLFAQRGFVMNDTIKREILFNEQVEWWYRQNIYVFIARDCTPHLNPGLSVIEETAAAEWVHLYTLGSATPTYTLRRILKELPGALVRAVRHRLRLR